ncbi:MAG: hypothetical protein WBC00_02755 [Candidatus Omnitrophota bacterium]
MKKKKYPKEFKARVALEALKGEKSIAQISSEYQVHGNMVSKCQKTAQRQYCQHICP